MSPIRKAAGEIQALGRDLHKKAVRPAPNGERAGANIFKCQFQVLGLGVRR